MQQKAHQLTTTVKSKPCQAIGTTCTGNTNAALQLGAFRAISAALGQPVLSAERLCTQIHAVHSSRMQCVYFIYWSQ